MAIMTPSQTTRGTESLYPDAVIAIRNAVVQTGSDDHHLAAATGATPPRGVLIHDLAGNMDVAGQIKKNVAVFGLYPDSLQAVASAPIAVNAQLVADPANPGQVITLPAAAVAPALPATYYVIGRSRFAVVSAGDPVSIIHQVPVAVVQ